MASPEWLRTFLAIYRTGSVSAGAAQRGLSQPAASQQLAALERRVGRPLFVRTPTGVEPTPRGRELMAQVADSLDQLEPVLVGLDGGTLLTPDPALRMGSSPEFFSLTLLPRLGGDAPALVARFGSDHEVVALLEQGELDLAVTSTTPGRRSLATTPLGTKSFVLVGPPGQVPEASFATLEDLGRWLDGRAWVAYSAELPLTRRFWLATLGRPFAGDLRLVAPDLRAVAAAVAHGLGVSLLPDFACRDGLARGDMVEIHPVADLVPTEPWFASTRVADVGRPPLVALIELLGRGPGRAA
jgi:DNA-binding transcriptional LysR family regulator